MNAKRRVGRLPQKTIATGIGFLLSPALAPLIVLPHSPGAYLDSEQPLLPLLAPHDYEDHPLALDAFETHQCNLRCVKYAA
jgi:hypothetical protein